MHTLAIAALHLLQFLATIPTLSSQDIGAIPGCTSKCHNISIPYPFGIGDERCYFHEGFKLACKTEEDPPGLYMNNAGYRVVGVKWKTSRVVYLDTSVHKLLGKSRYDENWNLSLLDDRLYRVSTAQNVFVALGCGFRFSVSLPGAGVSANTCDSKCQTGYPKVPIDGTCTGIGCCSIAVSEDSNSYAIKLVPLDEAANSTMSGPRDLFNATYFVEKGEYWRRKGSTIPLQKYAASLVGASPESAPPVPTYTVVNWMFGNLSCAEAQRSNNSGCLSDKSDCHDEPPRGYKCQCHQGYDGNPYMPNGCQGMHLPVQVQYLLCDYFALITN